MKTLQASLLKWYKQNHRKLPWRATRDPYKIWLSEIMCQQTQVATVTSYYNRFLESYPDIISLSMATEDEVYKLWEGLGYYSRAKRLMQCARVVTQNYSGIFPRTHEEIIDLPGIGPYTAGAIASIAYDIKMPAVDGNVLRVYSRLYGIEEDVGKADTKKKIEAMVSADLPEDVRDYNQALMELGALICVPKNPRCKGCPVHDFCTAKERNIQNNLPIKTPKAKKQIKKMRVAYVEFEDQVLLEKRGTEGLLANLWGFPIIEVSEEDPPKAMIDYLEDNYGLYVIEEAIMATKKHVFTHLIWDMTLVRYKSSALNYIEDPEVVWIQPEAIKNYPLPTAFLKLLK
ncbi:A/G-specific adenine glycosylase [Petrocella sp. FN5]|uniref:A/G-specific adenine glycosylase n=1 Tax=Petrocella sp. FN5 TaxID=3032002 RepID=UPI0023DA0BD9|nr:A/G-specific adenine glycosylase [Petrocella sp. FN5]MDF1618533.1 A/G-specific adenine glycosylase [Petrocella sp. FN5]